MNELNISYTGFLDKQQIDALSILYIVLLSLSVTGSFSVLLVSIVRWRHLRGQVHLLVQLALADLLAAVILLYTSVVNIMKVHPDTNATDCLYRLPLSLTFYFISFLLAIIYAWKSKNAIQGWRERAADDEDEYTWCRRQITAIPMYAFAWLIPLAVYFAYVCTQLIIPAILVPINDRSQDDTSYCNSCILFLHVWEDPCIGSDIYHDTFIRIFLVIAVLTVMFSCTVIYFKVGKWYERYMHDGLFPVEGDGHSRRQFKRVFSTARNIVLVILFCWAPALLLLLLSLLMIWAKVQQKSFYGLYVMQAATVSLQGFLNSMVYAWRRPNFTEAVLGENTPLLRYDRKAFFEESLRR
ncbi:hypothetical protein CRENBAI_017832 [Crenichthys baileyi]|uniref:G-protein coupled receptors family 1 profile domain-containing protein n=1 Tax=Crenichthys baileyi TaxID=28760 RepID=A0AAV9S3Z6_9TELE